MQVGDDDFIWDVVLYDIRSSCFLAVAECTTRDELSSFIINYELDDQYVVCKDQRSPKQTTAY
jgi:hypothetical protein